MENNDRPMFKLKNIDKVSLEKNTTKSNILVDAENIKEIIAKNNKAGSNGSGSKEPSITRKIYNFILKNSLAICITVISAIIVGIIKNALHIS